MPLPSKSHDFTGFVRRTIQEYTKPTPIDTAIPVRKPHVHGGNGIIKYIRIAINARSVLLQYRNLKMRDVFLRTFGLSGGEVTGKGCR